MKKITRALTVAVTFILLACVLIGCAKNVGDFSVNKKIVCEVNGQTVTYDEYKYFFYGNYVSLYGDDFSDLSNEKYQKVKALTEDALRRRAYIYKLCEEYEIELSKEDKQAVNDYVALQIEAQGGEQDYKTWLVQNRLSGAVFRSQVELTYYLDPALRELLQTGIDRIIDMTDEAVIADVNSGNFYRYAQIYYSVDAGMSDRAAYEKIQKAKEKLDSGVSFYDVANVNWTQDSDEKAKYRSEWGADVSKGAYVSKGQKEALVENTVLALSDNQYSEPIWSGNGWHIFIRLPIDIEYVKKNIHTQVTGEYTIADQSFARRYLEHIATASKDIKIEYAKYFTASVTFEMLLQKETLD